jgi:hypothetical protein
MQNDLYLFMRYLLLVLFCLPLGLFSQHKIMGYVFDEKRNTPLVKASVFLSNTSTGTLTNEKGYFELFVPAGKFELIVSYVGFQTYQQVIGSFINQPLRIQLREKSVDLDEVVIDPYEKDGWEKWGEWFYEQFVGTSAYGKDCKIKNPEILRFRILRKINRMTVIAQKPIIIENKALGYRITYHLEAFEYDFKERRLLYAGFPFFEQIKGGSHQNKKWIQARQEVFYGSVMHFMRSLYSNTITESGFEMRYLFKSPNLEKERVKQIYRSQFLDQGAVINLRADSASYYNRILKEPDVKTEIGKFSLTRDSIGHMTDSSVFTFHNKNYILVYYKNKPVPLEYAKLYPGPGTVWSSEMFLMNGEPIELYKNGIYFSPTELIFGGFWAWWGKIGTLLPEDYQVSGDF